MRIFSEILDLIEPAILAAENEHGPANVAAKHDQVLRELTGEHDGALPKDMRVEVQNAVNTLIHAAVESLTQQHKLPEHTPRI